MLRLAIAAAGVVLAIQPTVKADTDRARALVQQAQNKVAVEFLARHGVVEPDIAAKYEVARRRGVLFAVILDECWHATRRTEDFALCLDQREKAEVMLGNDLSRP